MNALVSLSVPTERDVRSGNKTVTKQKRDMGSTQHTGSGVSEETTNLAELYITLRHTVTVTASLTPLESGNFHSFPVRR